jgi:hypothetical protein
MNKAGTRLKICDNAVQPKMHPPCSRYPDIRHGELHGAGGCPCRRAWREDA